MFCYFCVGILVLIFVILFFTSENVKPYSDMSGRHVIVTGGSSGIGLSTCQKFVKLGAHVTILARDKNRLKEAEQLLTTCKIKNEQKIICLSTDVSNQNSIETNIKKAIEECGGKVDVLVTSAGASRPGKIDEVPLSEFERLMDVNYMGTLYSIQSVLPYMKKQNSGKLVLVSSMAGLAGIVGFSCYTPGKFALRGLAEVLHMELKPFNISVSVSYPPDVDTPMLRDEMQFKPEETKIISEGAGLFKPDQVAEDIVSSVTKSYKFFIVEGLDGFLLSVLCCGFAPSSFF